MESIDLLCRAVMSVSRDYLERTTLLMQVLPKVAKESDFALRGGTAINIFYQDMSRLPASIELTWLPVEDREIAVRNIEDALRRIADAIMDNHPGIYAQYLPQKRIACPRIIVFQGDTWIKIETSMVKRGTVLPPDSMVTSKAATRQFGEIRMNVASFADTYAGKIYTALRRKYPRDLFDLMIFYKNGEITDELFRVFLVHVASSNQPIHKVLSPSNYILKELYHLCFQGMTWKTIPIETLTETAQRLHSDIASRLSGSIATFLLSLHNGDPDFQLIGLPQAEDLPAVRWKAFNLKKLKFLNREKHARQRKELEKLFH